MDDLTLLLDRAVLSSLQGVEPPPVCVIARRARRRSTARTVASVTLVIAMTVGGVIGLAGAGRATETTGGGATATATAPTLPTAG